MWIHPSEISFKSVVQHEPIPADHPLRKFAFRTLVTDAWAGRRWLIHDSSFWNELRRNDDGSWQGLIRFGR
jgi:hypothetical protein